MNGPPQPKSDQAGLTLLGLAPEQGRWLLLALGLCINLALGSIYSWSVFVDPLTSHFQDLGQPATAGDVLLPFSVFLVSFALAMPLAGRFIESTGPRRIAMAGGFLTGAGWLLASFAPSSLWLSIAFGVVGGTGVGIAYGVPLTMAARWFPDRRGGLRSG